MVNWTAGLLQSGAAVKRSYNIQRREIIKLLDEMPSLRNTLREDLPKVYRWAADDAVEQMGLLRNPFPESSSFSLDQLLDTGFFPG